MIESPEPPLLAARLGYWDGAFQPAPDRDTFAVHDPATGELLAELPVLGAKGAEQAVRSAEAALATPPPLAERRRILTGIAGALGDHRDALAVILTRENGKPLAEARAEVDYAAGFYQDAATHLDALQTRTLDRRPKDLTWQVHHRPAGVAGLITPWNFPLAMLAKKLAGALAAGCPAVVKPARQTPLTCIAFFALLDELGLPAGLVNLVFGGSSGIGEVLCTHPAVRVISFTGSTEVGTLLAEQCAPHVKRLSLELGGNAPYLVFEDADLDHAAAQLMVNKFRASGQTCVCANRVLVARSVLEPFVERVVERVARLKVGHGLEPGVQVGPLIDAAGWDKVARHVREAESQGATVVHGGVPTARSPFFPPTVLTGMTPEMACFREETFGPLVAIGAFDDEAEGLSLARDTEHGLAAYLFTADDDRIDRLLRGLPFGHVGVNTGTGPTPEAPFGGWRHSGHGREGGFEGILEFIELQTVPLST